MTIAFGEGYFDIGSCPVFLSIEFDGGNACDRNSAKHFSWFAEPNGAVEEGNHSSFFLDLAPRSEKCPKK